MGDLERGRLCAGGGPAGPPALRAGAPRRRRGGFGRGRNALRADAAPAQSKRDNQSGGFSISIWQARMAWSAMRWLCGVTPAQQAASTVIGTSGKKARSNRALLMTQMSVQRPMRVIDSMGYCAFMACRRSPREVLPKVGLSMISAA